MARRRKALWTDRPAAHRRGDHLSRAHDGRARLRRQESLSRRAARAFGWRRFGPGARDLHRRPRGEPCPRGHDALGVHRLDEPRGLARDGAHPRGQVHRDRDRADPQRVNERAPSAELGPDQTDPDSLPPYEVGDGVVERYMERDMAPGAIAGLGYDLEAVRKVVNLIRVNKYKRRQAPPGVRI